MESLKPKVGIIGTGPIGQITAVHLKEAGCEVMLCDSDTAKMNLIREKGIVLQGKTNKKESFVHLFTSAAELAKQNVDILIFAVKVYHTKNIALAIREVSEKNIFAISAQNGIDAEQELASVFGIENTLRMVINFAGNQLAPNEVNVTFFNPPNYIASLHRFSEKVSAQTADTLTKVGLNTVSVASSILLKQIWEKTILNASLSALCGISRCTMKEIIDNPEMVEIVKQLIQEAVHVATANDIFFDDGFIESCIAYLKKSGNHFPSLAVDMFNNRETEIDYFNGKIVEYGNKFSVSAPMNNILTILVKTYTQKQQEQK